MRKNFLLLIFALLGTVAWAGVKKTYVVTQPNGTCYKFENGNFTSLTTGFGCKFVSADEVLSVVVGNNDNKINWGYGSKVDFGFRVNQGNTTDIYPYTLSVPANYKIISYTFGAGPNGEFVAAIDISTNSDMTNATTLQKGTESTEYKKEVGEVQETVFYLKHNSAETRFDATLTVVVDVPIDPEVAVREYLTDDKIANVELAGQYGYPKTTTQTYKDIKSIVEKLDQPGATWTAEDYDNVQTCYDAYLAEEDIVKPETGKFYRIYAEHPSKGKKYLKASENKAICVRPLDPNDASFIWYYDEDKNLTTFSTGYQLASDLPALVCEANHAVEFEKSSNQFGWVNMTSNGAKLFIEAGNDANTDLATNTDGGVAGVRIYGEEVNELPIALRDGGDNKHYATLTLPVGVTINGAEAYAPTLNENNYFMCEEALIEVPANTPVILIGEGESATATATINPTASTAETAETLSGTIQAIVRPEGKNVYVLSVDGDNNLGFYKYEGTNIPGFKAYYVGAATEANGFVLNFADDNITGIVSAENAAAAAQTHYDLQGRRVAAPQKGQLYIVNGKKVLY